MKATDEELYTWGELRMTPEEVMNSRWSVLPGLTGPLPKPELKEAPDTRSPVAYIADQANECTFRWVFRARQSTRGRCSVDETTEE